MASDVCEKGKVAKGHVFQRKTLKKFAARLNEAHGNRRDADDVFCSWPPRSLDLTPCECFCGGCERQDRFVLVRHVRSPVLTGKDEERWEVKGSGDTRKKKTLKMVICSFHHFTKTVHEFDQTSEK
ncbi:hypothetical protein TNCV_2719331 [Trichonephila clavipes]|nr:hypothetical protein TNCV_2719331 [Trichonephila clavipes]